MGTDHVISSVVHICREGFSSSNCVKNGYGWNLNKQTGERVKVPRYLCKKCGKTFYALVRKYEISNDVNQLRRLILELYIEGLTEEEITKALKHFPRDNTYLQESTETYIDEFFKNTPPHILKYLTSLRPKQRSKHFSECSSAGVPRYSLYLEAGEHYTSYALYMKGMSSHHNDWYRSHISAMKSKLEMVENIKKLLTLQNKDLDFEMNDVAEIVEYQFDWLQDHDRSFSKEKVYYIRRMKKDIPLIFNYNSELKP